MTLAESEPFEKWPQKPHEAPRMAKFCLAALLVAWRDHLKAAGPKVLASGQRLVIKNECATLRHGSQKAYFLFAMPSKTSLDRPHSGQRHGS